MTDKQKALEALGKLRPMLASDTPNEYWYEIAMVISQHIETIENALRYAASPPQREMDVEACLADLDRAKEFVGGVVATRGYGDNAYSAICRVMKALETGLLASTKRGDGE